MNSVGKINLFDVEKKYHVGFKYAQNILNRLTEIGYIKKESDVTYVMLQTEEVIHNYICTHLDELRPNEYLKLGIKDNGKYTFKSKFKINLAYYSIIIPVFIRRILFSIPEAIIFLPIMFILTKAETAEGDPLSLGAYFFISCILYITIGIPSNICIRIIQSHIYKMRFKEFMLLEKNWFFKRLKKNYEISHLLHPNRKIILLQDYDATMQELNAMLKKQLELAKHYVSVANSASNETEFYTAINSSISVLEWMSQFEKYDVLAKDNKPSDIIKTIRNDMPASLDRLHKRVKNDNNSLDNSSPNINKFDIMDGHEFEYFCANLLKKNNFANVEVTQGSGDHGIDILAEKDGITYAIQCKCYSSNVGNAAVQQAYSGRGIYKKDIAVVITNQYFTAQAKEDAAAVGVKLWDRDKLQQMIDST